MQLQRLNLHSCLHSSSRLELPRRSSSSTIPDCSSECNSPTADPLTKLQRKFLQELFAGRQASAMPIMDRGSKRHHTGITTLLLVTTLLASAMHIAAQSTTNAPPAEDVDLSKYKKADPNDIDIPAYSLVTFAALSGKDGVCHLTGYYNDRVLKTKTDIQDCFLDISSHIDLTATYFSDTSYYGTTLDCVMRCEESSAGFAASAQMRFPSLAFAVLAFLVLNYS